MNETEFFNKLLETGIIDNKELERLKVKHKEDPFAIVCDIRKQNPESREVLGRLWGDFINVSYINIEKTIFHNDLLDKLPQKYAIKYSAIPLYKGLSVSVATPYVHNDIIIKEIEKIIEEPVSPVFCFPDDVKEAIEIQYRSPDNIKEISNSIVNNPRFQYENVVTKEDLKKIAEDTLIVKLTDELIIWAIKERASDIHIEPEQDQIRVRYRIDGLLQEKLKLDKTLLLPLVSRIKILSNVDIIEKRRPQDGRINYNCWNRNIDIRFSVIPTAEGEKVVLRLLGHSFGKEIPDLNELDFSNSVSIVVKNIISYPNGIFFVTGPTGSGKTTTLFSILKYLNKPDLNIITIEDPIEYKLKGINQVQVNSAVNLDFANALRSFLRQDPDIMLVGEIRDVETSKIAIQAALTGHLVLATMHTNNSIQALTRLTEIGVEPFLVAPSIIGVMAQRLVRKNCENCKEEYILSKEEARQYFTNCDNTEIKFYKGMGCERCGNTGYHERIAVHEVYKIDNETRNLIVKGASAVEIQKYAYSSGFKNMWHDGLKKVIRGLTSIDELKRVIIAEV